MLGLSMLEPGITALKTIEKLALDFLKEVAPHPPGPQIYKTSPPAMSGTKREQQPNLGIRSKKTKEKKAHRMSASIYPNLPQHPWVRLINPWVNLRALPKVKQYVCVPEARTPTILAICSDFLLYVQLRAEGL